MDHLDYLKRYQSWRRGEDERTMSEAGMHPAEIGRAIDAAIEEIELLREVATQTIEDNGHLGEPAK